MRNISLAVMAAATFSVALFVFVLSASPAWADATLRITKSDTVFDPATVGENLQYDIVVENTGPDPAENVRLTDPVPDNTTFRSAEVVGSGNCDEPPVGATTGTIRCTLGDIPVGGSETVRIVVRPTAAAGEAGFVDNMATAQGANTDSARDRERTTVEESGITIEKDDTPDPVDVGESLRYTLTIDNDSGATPDVNIVDELPDSVEFISVEPNSDCSESSNVVRCSFDNLALGETTVRIFVEPTEEGTIENTARVFAQGDRSTTLAEASERTRVEEQAADPPPDDPDDPEDPENPVDPTAEETILECSSFSSQADAQAALDNNQAGSENLDPDNDDEACEDFTFTTTNTDDTNNATDNTADDATDEAQADDVVRDADAAAAINCVDILSAFRASGASSAQYQYNDLKLDRSREFDLVDDDRLQECLAREVIDRDAVKGETLADTGGLPLVSIAALLLAGAGIFVSRSVIFGGSSRDDD